MIYPIYTVFDAGGVVHPTFFIVNGYYHEPKPNQIVFRNSVGYFRSVCQSNICSFRLHHSCMRSSSCRCSRLRSRLRPGLRSRLRS